MFFCSGVVPAYLLCGNLAHYAFLTYDEGQSVVLGSDEESLLSQQYALVDALLHHLQVAIFIISPAAHLLRCI